jgi:hypothetical protein
MNVRQTVREYPAAILRGTTTYIVLGTIGIAGLVAAAQLDVAQNPRLGWALCGGLVGTVAGTIVTMVSTTGSYREKFRNALIADLLSSLLSFLSVWLLSTILCLTVALQSNTDPVVLVGLGPFLAAVVVIFGGLPALVSIGYTASIGSLVTMVGKRRELHSMIPRTCK